MSENCRAVLRSEVRSLAIHLGWVVLSKNIEQLFIAHLCWIERHLHDFCVSGLVGAHIFVGGIRCFLRRCSPRPCQSLRDLLECRFTPQKQPAPRVRNLWHDFPS